MPSNRTKIEALRSSGALNRHPKKVRHPLFAEHDFFDPNDMVQLKYETVRAIDVDGRPIAQAALDYGLSRPTIYEAHARPKSPETLRYRAPSTHCGKSSAKKRRQTS